jgi:hypothetical protein
MQSEGLSAVPVTNLQAIVSRITASRAAAAAAGNTSSSSDPSAAADEPAAAADAAAAAAAAESSMPAMTPEQMPGAWKALASVAGKMVEDVFRPVAFIENNATDTQVKPVCCLYSILRLCDSSFGILGMSLGMYPAVVLLLMFASRQQSTLVVGTCWTCDRIKPSVLYYNTVTVS